MGMSEFFLCYTWFEARRTFFAYIIFAFINYVVNSIHLDTMTSDDLRLLNYHLDTICRRHRNSMNWVVVNLSFKLRSCLTCFRLSSHDLNIETGRYQKKTDSARFVI